ncbi:hypothetical protein ACFX14_040636 [Malus domestica]
MSTPSVAGVLLGPDLSLTGLVLLRPALQTRLGFALSPTLEALMACPFSAQETVKLLWALTFFPALHHIQSQPRAGACMPALHWIRPSRGTFVSPAPRHTGLAPLYGLLLI